MAANDKKLTEKDLSPDQREVYEQMLAWTNGETPGRPIAGQFPGESIRMLRVGGFAGTGKSTLLGVFAAQTDLLVAYVTYTGRASSVLKRKLVASGVVTTTQLQRTSSDPRHGWSDYYSDVGVNLGKTPLCTTIHRLLYKPIIDEITEELRGWTKRGQLDRNYDLIVVDEASMVSDEILQDIASHGIPLLAVGDHGQLEPVAASGDLMQNPDLRLEKIHRQAEGNPIIALSRVIREGGRMIEFKGYDLRVNLAARSRTADVLAAAYQDAATPLDVGLLCWTNRMRVKLNGLARSAAGFKGSPSKGEAVICLKNYPPVFNGMRGLLTQDTKPGSKASPWHLYANVEFPDEGLPSSPWTLCAPQFCREKVFGEVEELRERGMDVYSMSGAGAFMDFGYALTVHKSQGSGFSHVVWYVDRPEKPYDESWRRFAYTAITRAADSLTIIR